MRATEIRKSAMRTLNTKTRFETVKGEASVTVSIEEGDSFDEAANLAQTLAMQEANKIASELVETA